VVCFIHKCTRVPGSGVWVRILQFCALLACGLNYCKLCRQYEPTGVPSFSKCACCLTRPIVPRHENLGEFPAKFEIYHFAHSNKTPVLQEDYPIWCHKNSHQRSIPIHILKLQRLVKEKNVECPRHSNVVF
jgi:hypothetical protein